MMIVNGIKLYDTEELVALLGISAHTIAAYRKAGLLPYTMIGRAKYTSEEALRDYLNGKTMPAKRTPLERVARQGKRKE